MFAIARHRRFNTMKGGSWKRHIKEGITSLARKANAWLKDTRFISTRAKAHNHGLVRALGEAVESLPFVLTTARCAADAKEQHEQRKQLLFIQGGKPSVFPHQCTRGKQ